jgi:hypothetical protein
MREHARTARITRKAQNFRRSSELAMAATIMARRCRASDLRFPRAKAVDDLPPKAVFLSLEAGDESTFCGP